MNPSPLTWPQRFLRVTPPMPDWLFVGMLLLAVLMLGVALGLTVCEWRSPPQRPSFQQQLDAIDTRLRILEQR